MGGRRHMRLVVLVMMLAGLMPAIAYAAGPVVAGTAKQGEIAPANTCGCHAGLVETWSASMHSKAMVDPIYRAKVAEADKATNGALGPFCDKCHGPAATMLGQIGAGKQLDQVGSEGVGCDFCHHVTGLAPGEPGNTSHLVDPAGPRLAQIQQPAAPHPAGYSAFHESAEICGGCHNVNHPVNGMHLESTYSEWKASQYATDGVTCQRCHMSSAPGKVGPSAGQAAAGAPQRENIYQMTFVGGQVELGNSEFAKGMLQSAAAVEMDVEEIVGAGKSADVLVKISNVGAGHYLPTGLTEVREMWLEVFAEDEDGAKTPIGERRFGTILQDAKGNAPVELWEATAIKSDDRIPPKGSVTATYTFEMPEGTDGAKVRAVLNYRSTGDELAKAAGTKNPVTVMASAEKQVFSSEEARAAALTEEAKKDGASTGLYAGLAVVLVAIVGGAVFVMMRKRASA